MKHTLVAAFATLTDASRTQGDLMSRGIAKEQIHSVGADSADIHAYDAPYSTAGGTVDRTHHESKVAHFFKSLFGHEPHEDHRRHATAYPEAVRRGSLVIAVDVYDEDQLIRARDALEYNGALSIDDNGASSSSSSSSSSTPGYTGPTSPYAGATGGDSHLDKHFTGSNATTSNAATTAHTRSDDDRLSHAAGAGPTDDALPTDHNRTATVDTGQYDVGSSAKRAGTDYPDTLATNPVTGGGNTAQGSSVGEHPAANGAGSKGAGTCSDRVCVIQRPS
ncbi:hypothetical protein CH92_00320 [Stutzerimonas stutzeri]|uniref:Uncharacterized protein n=1 Tax=Stutzerimonas stutzeri TaxID=316 RepID=W8R5U1_STUST|nr:hypothetical protein [Stutzerimonas stutzeri]AHL73622.1 hypothetical protein CH92_00320 [Stutzerimonas stutzeri]MCQ4328865.1 hypothetical protein [Stutzerimonas stutzeri]